MAYKNIIIESIKSPKASLPSSTFLRVPLDKSNPWKCCGNTYINPTIPRKPSIRGINGTNFLREKAIDVAAAVPYISIHINGSGSLYCRTAEIRHNIAKTYPKILKNISINQLELNIF